MSYFLHLTTLILKNLLKVLDSVVKGSEVVLYMIWFP